MGYDATNYFPKEVNKQKVESFLVLLGYTKRGSWYVFFKDENYKYLYGVGANISHNENGVSVWTRTPIYCSDDDLRYQNYTIKKLRERFGGYFVSDNGKNRYFFDCVRFLRGKSDLYLLIQIAFQWLVFSFSSAV